MGKGIKTDKIKIGGVTYWHEYEMTEDTGRSQWLAIGQLCMRYHKTTLETDKKKSYGRSEKHALSGLRRRFEKTLNRTLLMINGDSETDPYQLH